MGARRIGLLCLLLCMAAVMSACGVTATTKDDSSSVNVYAAASLKGLMEAAQASFAEDYPDIHLQFNFAGTHVLKTQIEQGADADVFFAARELDVQNLQEQGLVADYSRYAGNHLVVAVSEENSGRFHSIADLTEAGILLVMAEPNAPAGEYAQLMIDQLQQSGKYGPNIKERLMKNIVSYESNEQHVLAKVELGEADAGFVYTSSLAAAAKAGKQLASLQIPDDVNITSYYYAARLTQASSPTQTFLDWLESDKGKELQASYGYLQGG